MSTGTVQMNRACKIFTGLQQAGVRGMIPPDVLEKTKAILFFKKLGKGKMSSSYCPGLFLKRTGYQTWSQPVCIHFKKGDLYWSERNVDKVDVIICVTDDKVVSFIESYSQVGFSDETNKLKKGIVMEKSEESMIAYAAALSETPEYFNDGDSFSYGVCGGKLITIHIESAVVQVRDSSNTKFYGDKNATVDVILAGLEPPCETKERLVNVMHNSLSGYFNVQDRFGLYTKTFKPSKNNDTTSTTNTPRPPAPAPVNNPARLHSQSSTSTSSSSSDESSDSEDGGYGSSYAEQRVNRYESEDVQPTRVRVTSFDFSM